MNYFPDDVDRLVEPFAGSAALSIAAAQNNKAKRFWLNDVNAPLIALWREIIERPQPLATRYQTLWQTQQTRERRFYDLVRMRFNKTQRPYYLLYLLARCVKAAVRYNANGEFNQSPDNRRKGKHPTTMQREIANAAKLLKGKTHLTSQDYQSVLRLVTPADVVYMDPPYQGVCANRDPRYIEGVVVEAFIEALADLNQRKIPYLVSYDGRTANKNYGQPLPEWLNLQRIELHAGRSSQATLLGRNATTYESLYLSPALIAQSKPQKKTEAVQQLTLFSEYV